MGTSWRRPACSPVRLWLPARPKERRYSGKRPRFFGKEIGYVAFRIDGFHGPALRTLLPDRLKQDTDLAVVYSPWDATGQRLPITRKSVHFAAIADPDTAAPGT